MYPLVKTLPLTKGIATEALRNQEMVASGFITIRAGINVGSGISLG